MFTLTPAQVEFELVYGPGCQTNVDDSMTINSISMEEWHVDFHSISTLIPVSLILCY